MEHFTTQTVEPCIFDPIRHSRGDDDQLVSVGAYRTVAYQPLTGKEIWRVSYGGRLLERASSCLRPWPGVHRYRVSGTGAHGRSSRRHR